MNHIHNQNLPAVRETALQAQETEPQWRGDIVQFNDGWCGLAWNIPGDRLNTGFNSDHKWLKAIGQFDNLAAIVTKSGNTYAMGDSLVINVREGGVYETEIPPQSVTIGDQAEIPGVGTTSDVRGLLVAYKHMDRSDEFPQIDQPSPFQGLAERLAYLRDQINAQRDQLNSGQQMLT